MKYIITLCFLIFTMHFLNAQKTSQPKTGTKNGGTKVQHGKRHVDERAPSKIQGSSNNAGQIIYAQRSAMGYRIMVLTTDNRDLAMKTRAKLLSRFPEQKPYMVYTAPTIKIKFGNFISKPEAERHMKDIKLSGIVSSTMYLIPEPVEVKPPARQPGDFTPSATPTTASSSAIKTSKQSNTTKTNVAVKKTDSKSTTKTNSNNKTEANKPKPIITTTPKTQKKPVIKPA